MQRAFLHDQGKDAEKSLSEDYFMGEGSKEGKHFDGLEAIACNEKSQEFRKLQHSDIFLSVAASAL